MKKLFKKKKEKPIVGGFWSPNIDYPKLHQLTSENYDVIRIMGMIKKLDDEVMFAYRVSRKWSPIMDALKVTDPKMRLFMSIYAESFQLKDYISYNICGNINGMGPVFPITLPPPKIFEFGEQIDIHLLPINMKILSRLNLVDKFYELKNSSLDSKKEIIIPITELEFQDIKFANGLDVLQKLENKIVDTLVNRINDELETKNNFTVWSVFQSIAIFNEYEITIRTNYQVW
jgi:hypothetical protein